MPPVHAFWSLTMYNDKQLFAANPIDRYAIGDRDKLAFNPDGSLDLYIQRKSPGQGKESNWLPAPATGTFTIKSSSLLAEARSSRRKLGAAGGEAGAITSLAEVRFGQKRT